ncbi:hypothetical protein BR93DRAFT_226732 [Coniochaeta sp. PMI_546]|nr:hypothetical protein BR93DRAFT_226732 [Coniochaeta sp. PMI_546]
MSLRKSACSSCVAAKRRCDLGLPACLRCTKRAQSCVYPYPRDPPTSKHFVHAEELIGIAITSTDVSVVPTVVGSGPWDGDEPLHVFLDSGLSGTGLDSFGLGSGSNMMESADIVYFSSLRLAGGSTGNGATAATHSGSEQYSSDTGNRPVIPDGTNETGQEPPSYLSQWIFEVPQLTRTLSYIWPRANELGTWAFCASELVSYVGLFAQAVSTPFISLPTDLQSSRPIDFHPPLRAAYGVCAAYTTLTAASQPFFEQVLDEEVDNLIGSPRFGHSTGMSVAYGNSNSTRFGNSVDTFREHLARVQTMILYYLIRAFGCSSRQRSLAEQLEPLLAAWTVELQLRLKLLDRQQCLTAGGENQFQGFCSTILRPEELQGVYRTILVSYLARSVYSVIKYKTTPLLAELASLPVLTPPISGKASVLYQEFADLWRRGGVAGVDENDRFTNLLLVACRGLTVKTGL